MTNHYFLSFRYVTASKAVPSVVYCSKMKEPGKKRDEENNLDCLTQYSSILLAPLVIPTSDSSSSKEYKVPVNCALTTITDQPMQKPTLVTEKPQQIQHHQKPRSRSPPPRNYLKEEAPAAPPAAVPKIVVKTEPPSSVFPATKSPNSNHENIYRVSSQPPKLLPLLPTTGGGEHHATAGKRRSMPTLYSHPIVPQSLFFKEEPPNSPTYHGASAALVNGAVSYSLTAAVNGASGAVSIPGARYQHDQHRRPSAPALAHYQPVKSNSSRSSPTVAPSRGSLPSYKYNNRRMAPVSELLARMRGVPKSEISRMNSAPNAGKRARRLHTIVHAQVSYRIKLSYFLLVLFVSLNLDFDFVCDSIQWSSNLLRCLSVCPVLDL